MRYICFRAQEVRSEGVIHFCNSVASLTSSSSSWGGVKVVLLDIELPQLNDIKESSFVKKHHIGRHSHMTDSHFFYKKRLNSTIETIVGSMKNSIDVWFEYYQWSVAELKQAIELFISTHFNLTISKIIKGLVVGNRVEMYVDGYHLFKITGTQHLIVISGFHLSLIASFITKVTKKYFSSLPFFLSSLLCVTVYCLVIGYSISLFRAYFMFLLFLIAVVYNRQKHSLYSFIFLLFILFIVDISIIKNISFQLSYVATASILLSGVVYQPQGPFFNLYVGTPAEQMSFVTITTQKILNYLWESVYIGSIVQLGIFPILIYHFGEISLVGVVTSTLVTWLIPLIIQYGVFFLIIGIFAPPVLAAWIAIPLSVIVSLLYQSLHFFVGDWAVLTVTEIPVLMIIFYYFFLMILYLVCVTFKKHMQRKRYEKKYCFSL